MREDSWGHWASPRQMKGPAWVLWVLPQWDGSLVKMWEECPVPSELGWSPWCVGL